MAPPRVAPRRSVYSGMPQQVETPRHRFYLEVVCGFGYLGASILASFYYLQLLSPYLANDGRLTNFNQSGAHSFLIDITNRELEQPRLSSMNWNLTTKAMTKDYSSTHTPLLIQPSYPRRMLLEDTRVEAAIRRSLQASVATLAKIPTQYCWVDFERRWGLAHTRRRQQRCVERDIDNAAVYLESTLRLVNWNDWAAYHGALFATAIVMGLTPPGTGQAWVRQCADAVVVDVAAESAFWRAHGMTRNALQWQNYQQDGVFEYIAITTGFSNHLIQVKRVEFSNRADAPWSTWTAYWGIWNDWAHAATLAKRYNASLVTPANATAMTVQALDFEFAVNVATQLSSASSMLIRRVLGPFLSIDMRYVPLPASLFAYFSLFVLHLDQDDQNAKLSNLDPIPTVWTDEAAIFLGGSPLCAASPVLFQWSFGFDKSCSRNTDSTLPLDATSTRFALFSVQDRRLNVSQVCNQCELTKATCQVHFESVVLPPSLDTQLLSKQTYLDLREDALASIASVSIVQLARRSAKSTTMLLRHPVVAGNSSWDVFGWVMVYDWLRGNREVVELDGDVSSLTLLSSFYPPISFEADPNDVPTTTGQALGYIMLYISVLLTGIAAMLVMYTAWNRCSIIGRNLFRFNRVVGCVWIGRPLLLVRGISAILLLSRDTLELQKTGATTSFVSKPRSLVESMVVAGEASWTVYVVHDVMLLGSDHAHLYSPLANAMAWLALVCLDVFAPYTTTATISRTCIAKVEELSCTVGTINLGSQERVWAIVGIFAGCTLVCVAAVAAWNRKCQNPVLAPAMATLLLPASVEALLDIPLQNKANSQAMDTMTCVLAGLFPLAKHGKTYLFDVKLWRFVPCEMIDHLIHVRTPTFPPLNFQHPQPSPSASRSFKHGQIAPESPCKPGPDIGLVVQPPATPNRRRARQLLVGMSVLYMIGSVATSMKFVRFVAESIDNDLFWMSFNSTGTHTFLANWFTNRVLTSLDDTPSLVAVDHIDTMLYNQSGVVITQPPLYASWTQLEIGSNLTKVISGLRQMRATDALWMSIQYCWLDFHQRWEMATTATRQQRCQAKETENGAVYFEGLLRNVPWDVWRTTAVGPFDWLNVFDVAFVAELNSTMRGKQFWASVQAQTTSAREESELWANEGISHYTTQWQNYKSLGITESFVVHNAFGLSYPLSLKASNGTYRIALQTSLKLYWTISMDLVNVMINQTEGFGGSLLRQSSTFAYRNVSISTVMQRVQLTQTSTYHVAVVNAFLGPFGSIDAKVRRRPRTLLALYRNITSAVVHAIQANESFAQGFGTIKPAQWSLKGHEEWEGTSLRLEGGDMMCAHGTPIPKAAVDSMIESFGLSHGCTARAATIAVDSSALLFAVTAWRLRHPTTTLNTTYVCSGRSTPRGCPATLTTTTDLALSLTSFQNIATNDAFEALSRLQLSQTQFSISAQNARQFWVLPLFNAKQPQFEFFAWCLLHDWVMGYREVVTFEGDRGAITAMSARYPTASWQPDPGEIPRHVASFLRVAVVYVTSVLALVATFVVLYTVLSHGHIEPRNVLHINRVAGYVWIGRPLLFARSMVALGILSTSKASLVRRGSLNMIQMPPSDMEHYVRAILSSSEACWLVFVIQDILTIVTRDRTQTHAGWASIFVWVVSAVLSCLYPVAPTVKLEQDCHFVVVDAQVTCQSGSIAIGDVRRFCLFVAFAVGSVVVSVLIQLCCQQRVAGRSKPSSSLFLCNGAKNLFRNQAHWTHHGVYFLDMASAVMNGLLVVPWQGQLHVLDVKTWRYFVIDKPQFQLQDNVPTHLHFSVPLIE